MENMKSDIREWNLTEAELDRYLEALISWEALELDIKRKKDKVRVRIPYVMNDACECFIELADCVTVGSWNPEVEGLTYNLTVRENRALLTLNQGETCFQIGFRNAKMVLGCYQYHRIGHAWRKKAGEEYIRRLVNLICVLNDKATYLGELACNEQEMQLADLAGFAPIRFWTPINDSIMDWYEDTPEGAFTMRELTLEAGERTLADEILRYEMKRKEGNLLPAETESLAEKFLLPEGEKLYQLLLEKMEKASLFWPERAYDLEVQLRIRASRQQKQAEFEDKGYEGTYPLMILRNSEGEIVRTVRFVEEHPFTVMEAEEYSFRIFEEYVN